MHHRLATALVLPTLVALAGCYRGPAPRRAVSTTAAATAPPAGSACAALGPRARRFGEVLDESAETKARLGSYAGVLELLLDFERASGDFEVELGSVRATDPATADAAKRATDALAQANAFARAARVRAEKAAARIAPLAADADAAGRALRAECPAAPSAKSTRSTGPHREEASLRPPVGRGLGRSPRGKARSPRAKDCAAVDAALAKLAATPYVQHAAVADELAAVPLSSPTIADARDRAVSATKALAAAAVDENAQLDALSKQWSEVQRSVKGALEGVTSRCKGDASDDRFVADAKPDPRKLTVLVRAKPPAGIAGSLVRLASSSENDVERAFYQARAQGAFGSGFVVVRATPAGGRETLIITNRHVVELADRATLELADGTELGGAEIAFTDTLHDVAVLRPERLTVDKGFAFAPGPAKDQEGVIATGFPGMAGHPSYQTTRGYVSNEAFKLVEGARAFTYVQHTAAIDPGSSGGPLTDERGNVLGLNTLKVNNREAVALAVPSTSILEALHRADAAASRLASPDRRAEAARLACLAFVGELASPKPRVPVLEAMISNELTGEEGLTSAGAFADDEAFGRLWQNDSVRAMRVATILRVQNSFARAGGPSVFETCSDVSAAEPPDAARFRVRLASGETRAVGVRFEHGHAKIVHVDLPAGALVAAPPDHAGKTNGAKKPKKPKKPTAASR